MLLRIRFKLVFVLIYFVSVTQLDQSYALNFQGERPERPEIHWYTKHFAYRQWARGCQPLLGQHPTVGTPIAPWFMATPTQRPTVLGAVERANAVVEDLIA